MNNTRRYALARTIAPASEPLTLADTKLFLRVDSNSEDTLITDMIIAARMEAEQFLRRALITQTWKLAFDEYLDQQVQLPVTPVIAITSINAFDRAGVSQLIDSDVYYLSATKDVLTIDTIIFSHRVEVLFSAGYGADSDVPAPIRQGMLHHIAGMYDVRGFESVFMPEITQRLYMPFREVRL